MNQARTFHYREQAKHLLTHPSVSQIGFAYQYSGEWQILQRTAPNVLALMQKNALLHTISAGVRNNGLHIPFQNAKELVQENRRPQNEAECSVIRYKRALASIIEGQYTHQDMLQDIIRLNNLLYYDDPPEDCCQWRIHNTVYMRPGEARPHTHQLPNPAQAREMLAEICREYSAVMQEGEINPLYILPIFIVDFMAIQPFDRGYFEMMRLLHMYLMHWAGFYMVHTVSVETCFHACVDKGWSHLLQCLQDWDRGKNTYQPSFDMCMALIRESKRQFDRWTGLIQYGQVPTKDVVAMIIQENGLGTTKSMLLEYAPHLSESSIEQALYTLSKEGIIRRIGGGRYSEYMYCE